MGSAHKGRLGSGGADWGEPTVADRVGLTLGQPAKKEGTRGEQEGRGTGKIVISLGERW